MIAVEALSAGTQAVLYFIAFVAFVVAAVLAYMTKALWATLVSAGLAAFVFVFFWNALAAS